MLKTIKADKEDLEDALADKADAQVVNRKVSHDQFDAACDDLARGLEDAIAKLGQQESIWQQALDEVQREIEGKLDKIEISPLKDFVNNRLKTLQEKLKSLAEMRRDNEAAGAKRMLRRVARERNACLGFSKTPLGFAAMSILSRIKSIYLIDH